VKITLEEQEIMEAIRLQQGLDPRQVVQLKAFRPRGVGKAQFSAEITDGPPAPEAKDPGSMGRVPKADA
jgi:hypothetical protein